MVLQIRTEMQTRSDDQIEFVSKELKDATDGSPDRATAGKLGSRTVGTVEPMDGAGLSGVSEEEAFFPSH